MQTARTIFFDHLGDKNAMHNDGVLQEFIGLNVPRSDEVTWLRELVDDLFLSRVSSDGATYTDFRMLSAITQLADTSTLDAVLLKFLRYGDNLGIRDWFQVATRIVEAAEAIAAINGRLNTAACDLLQRLGEACIIRGGVATSLQEWLRMKETGEVSDIEGFDSKGVSERLITRLRRICQSDGVGGGRDVRV